MLGHPQYEMELKAMDWSIEALQLLKSTLVFLKSSEVQWTQQWQAHQMQRGRKFLNSNLVDTATLDT